MSRHQYANAAMRVFGLGHRRAREIYDLTLLEIRRVLWDETRHTPLIPANLKGTKGLPLVRYVNFLTPQEFSKFAALMNDLAPYVVISVKRSNVVRIRNGVWQAIREKSGVSFERDTRGDGALLKPGSHPEWMLQKLTGAI